MDADVQTYIDGIAPEHRPLFDRVHRLILRAYPDADVVLSYGMPTYRVGDRRLHVGVWRHGISVYGWDKDAGADLLSRHPGLLGGKGTIRLRSQEAPDVGDEELSALVRASLGPDRR
ncbi:iron chaperone [Streptomyces sp. NPDC019531]|uniref:iron chaperone n=1 Tax=Streptomyces sp. NPDC019531 TaxID=3365062 RepID=UPI00384E2907